MPFSIRFATTEDPGSGKGVGGGGWGDMNFKPQRTGVYHNGAIRFITEETAVCERSNLGFG